MYETKLRKHEREYPHPDENKIREIVRLETTRALVNFGGLLALRTFFAVGAAGVAGIVTLAVASAINNSPSPETAELVKGMASTFAGAAFLVVFVLYRWNE